MAVVEKRSSRHSVILLLLIFGLTGLVWAAMKRHTPPNEPPATPTVSANSAAPAVAGANELGLVPILEYHLIGYPEGEWRRTPENFRRDLEMLYSLGYYPISLLDYVHGRIDVPAGRSPVVLTFDDSSEGQFRAVMVNGKPRPDPRSAVGIMEDFARRHPDFPARATFYVLPGVTPKLCLFGQPEHRAWKLNYLVNHGYELGNHTLWHQNLGKASPEEVREQLARAQAEIEKYVPGYKLRTLSLPFGVWPKPRELAYAGSFQGGAYRHEAVMLVGAGPAPSPFARGFDPMALPRIQAGDGPLGPERALVRMGEGRYVSDGDAGVVAVPVGAGEQVGDWVEAWRVRVVE